MSRWRFKEGGGQGAPGWPGWSGALHLGHVFLPQVGQVRPSDVDEVGVKGGIKVKQVWSAQ